LIIFIKIDSRIGFGQKRRLITSPRPVPPYLLAVVEDAKSEIDMHQRA
jgi:hypothetical protein